MELLWLVARFDFNLVERRQDLVRDRSPAVVLNAVVPTVEVVVLGFIKGDIDGCLFLVLFKFHVIPRCKSIDINKPTVREDLIVNQWRELLATQSEPDVTAGCCVQETRLLGIDALE